MMMMMMVEEDEEEGKNNNNPKMWREEGKREDLNLNSFYTSSLERANKESLSMK